MRLTVRTLLAWIDGVLGPADHEALGRKVAASDVAPRLVERTDAVVANPAISTPPVEGRGLAEDANTTAEFLDNVLAGDRLPAFERVCIESDMHLAEAAACHRLLAEIARTPDAVEPIDSRRRRALLARVAAHANTNPSEAAAGGPAVHASREPRVRPGGVAAPAASGQGRSRRAPLAAWLSAAAAVALLAALGGVFAWSLSRGGRRGPPAVAVAAPAKPAAAPPEAATAPATAAADPAPAPPPAAVDSAMPPPASPPVPADPVATPPVADAVAVVPPAAPPAPPAPAEGMPPADPRVPQGDALAIVAPPPAPAGPPAAVVEPGGPQPPDAPVAAPPAVAAIAVDGGVVLHRVEVNGSAGWSPIAPAADLADREDLVVPPWCYPRLTIDGVTVRLHPLTRAVLTKDVDGTPRLEIVFGRAVVHGEAADARIGVTAGGLCGVLSGVLRQPAGIEVTLGREAGSDPAVDEPRRAAILLAGGGEKVWRQTALDGGPAGAPLQGIAAETVVPARASLAWRGDDPAAAAIGPPAAEPEWMGDTAPAGRVESVAARTLADRLSAPGDAVAALTGVAADRRVENRMIAAATLALLGSYDESVAVLCAEGGQALREGQWAMFEALTVPLALARGENAAAKLRQAFLDRGPAGKGERLFALACGFDDDDLASGGDATLVDALDDGSLAVRRYAILRLDEIVRPDQRHRGAYRADRPESLRKDGTAWWRGQLSQGRIRRVAPPPAAPGGEGE